MSRRLDDSSYPVGSASSASKLGAPSKPSEAHQRDPLAEGEPLPRSPWHVSFFLRRFLMALAIGLPVIFLVTSSWGEALAYSALLVVALQVIYLVLAFLFA